MPVVDAKGILAIGVTLGAFGLLGGYIFTGHSLDNGTGVALVAFCSSPLGLVLGFYFGHANGTQTALANAAVGLATQALSKRSTDYLKTPPTMPAVGA